MDGRTLMDPNAEMRAGADSCRLVHPRCDDRMAQPLRTLDLPSGVRCADVAAGLCVRDYTGKRISLASMARVNKDVTRRYNGAVKLLSSRARAQMAAALKTPVLPLFPAAADPPALSYTMPEPNGTDDKAAPTVRPPQSTLAFLEPVAMVSPPAPPLPLPSKAVATAVRPPPPTAASLLSLLHPPRAEPAVSPPPATAAASLPPRPVSRPVSDAVNPLAYSAVARSFLPGLEVPPPPEPEPVSNKRKACVADDDDDEEDRTLDADDQSVDMTTGVRSQPIAIVRKPVMPPPAASNGGGHRGSRKRHTGTLHCHRKLGYHMENDNHTAVMCHHHDCDMEIAPLGDDAVVARAALVSVVVDKVYRAHEWQTFMCESHGCDMTHLSDEKLGTCCHACARTMHADAVPMLHNSTTGLTLNLCKQCRVAPHVQSQLKRYNKRIYTPVARRRHADKSKVSAASSSSQPLPRRKSAMAAAAAPLRGGYEPY